MIPHRGERDADAASVEVLRREFPGDAGSGSEPVVRASLAGLQLCGSVWACPSCSGSLAWRRAVEIRRAVEAVQRAGGGVHLVTFTIRHTRGDRLADLFTQISAGWRGVVGSARWTGRTRRVGGEARWSPGDRETFGVAGWCRVIEATVSAPDDESGSGWHVHIHALAFTSAPDFAAVFAVDPEAEFGPLPGDAAEWGRLAFAARVFPAWAAAVARAGGTSSWAGFDVQTIGDGGAQFIGRYLQKATFDAARVGAEMATGDETKVARRGRLTPFELLHDLLVDPAAPRFAFRTPRSWRVEERVAPDARGRSQVSRVVVDAATGRAIPIMSPGAWRLWHDWEQASAGKRQVRWSDVPAHRDGAPASLSALDALWVQVLEARGHPTAEEVAAADPVVEVVGQVGASAWGAHLARRPSAVVDLLDAAEEGGAAKVAELLRTHVAGTTPEGEPAAR